MLVSQVMTTEVVSVHPDDPIEVALRLMRQGGFRRLPVVGRGRLVGIITDRDLRLATNSPLVLSERWYSEFLLETIPVKACMTPDPITVAPETPVLEALRLMRRHKIDGLPVLAAPEQALVGIVTTTDMMDLLIRQLEQAQTNEHPDLGG